MAFLRVKYKTGSWRTFSGFYSVDTIIGFAAAIIITLFFSELSKRVFPPPYLLKGPIHNRINVQSFLSM